MNKIFFLKDTAVDLSHVLMIQIDRKQAALNDRFGRKYIIEFVATLAHSSAYIRTREVAFVTAWLEYNGQVISPEWVAILMEAK